MTFAKLIEYFTIFQNICRPGKHLFKFQDFSRNFMTAETLCVLVLHMSTTLKFTREIYRKIYMCLLCIIHTKKFKIAAVPGYWRLQAVGSLLLHWMLLHWMLQFSKYFHLYSMVAWSERGLWQAEEQEPVSLLSPHCFYEELEAQVYCSSGY